MSVTTANESERVDTYERVHARHNIIIKKYNTSDDKIIIRWGHRHVLELPI